MKTFKQFMESAYTPKDFSPPPFRYMPHIRTPEIKKMEMKHFKNFLKNMGQDFPLAKKNKKDKKIASHDKRLFKTPPATGAAADVIAGPNYKNAAGVGKGSVKSGTPNDPFGVRV